MRITTVIALVCAAAAAVNGTAHAQTAANFPMKPVRLILPYPPGGGSDTIVRPLAQRLGENLKQQVVIDNRGGAGGNIGMELAAKAPPDGHTIVFALTAQLAVNPALYKKLPYDPLKDYEPITLLASGPYILLVHPSLPVKSVKDLIALARTRPNQITYASSGSGSGGHLANELLNSMANVKMLHIPYKGGGPALTAVLAGEAQVLFSPYATAKPQMESGRLRALGVSAARRLTGVDLPTIAEAALPGYDAGVWYAFLAPAGTPRDIVMKLNGEILRAASQPEMKSVLSKSALEPIGSTPDELGRFMKAEILKWAKVVKDANVHVD
ncbi:MAG: LacI family transcriptional regulator [Betaproteobacteria bacterium]|jgi:tripartite-type tricarboxylate transporter receptor subunit TctC|nr:LacI family transcriptional regulator [Betaproteobacteria bacterium]